MTPTLWAVPRVMGSKLLHWPCYMRPFLADARHNDESGDKGRAEKGLVYWLLGL